MTIKIDNIQKSLIYVPNFKLKAGPPPQIPGGGDDLAKKANLYILRSRLV